MQPRKFVTAERSANKESHRASYDTGAYVRHPETNYAGDFNRFPSSNNLLKPKTDDKMRFSQMQRSPSEGGFKTREELVRSNIARRKNDGMVSNLKSQLQSLKMEVSKLMNKQSDPLGYNSKKSVLKSEGELSEQEDDNVSLGNYGKDVSDTVSVTSEKIIDEPIRKLESKYNSNSSSGYDHSHYLQLENDLLKTELRNLKNKYNATKQQLKERCEALEKKNDYLEVSLQKSEESLHECKKNLQVEIQTIKFQITRKMQQELEDDEKRIKSRQMIEPQRDSGDNELIHTKMNKLYEELSEKSRHISALSIEMNEIRGEVEKKSFELKKQVEKNSELAKQLEFAKRDNSRNSHLLEQEVNRKGELLKTNEALREKINSLTKEIQYQDQVNVGSEELENRLSFEIKAYKQNEDRLTEENFELQTNLRKQKQLNDSHEQEIMHLKKSISEFTAQVEQISKSLRLEREKTIQTEEHYRKMLDETKESYETKIDMLKSEFERVRETAQEASIEKQEVKTVVHNDLKDKDRQISKWKAEYKLLKIKFEENFSQENMKKEEIDGYYKSYKEYKTKNKLLEMRNKILEESANQNIERIHQIESENLAERARMMEENNLLNLQKEQLIKNIQDLQLELQELDAKYVAESEKSKSEERLRGQLQSKVLSLDVEDNQQLMEILEQIKRRIGQQDERVNKFVKQVKKKDELINKLRKEIRGLLESQETDLENFKNKELAEAVQEIQRKTFDSLNEMKELAEKEKEVNRETNAEIIEENTTMKSKMNELEEQMAELKQEIKSITHLYNFKSAELEEMREKHNEEMEQQENKMEELEKFKAITIKNLHNEISGKNEQILMQRAEIKKLLSIRVGMNDEPFDEALRNQIETSKKLREELSKKNEEVYKLRDNHALLKTELDNLKSESDIAKLKFISDKKNIQVSHDMEFQQMKNAMSLQTKKVQALENKIKMVIDENKKKDAFIQTFIMGKKLPQSDREFITSFMKEYEITMTAKNINEKLQSESQELEKLAAYNFNLMKEIADMKERMLLYEAISVDIESELRESMEFDTPLKKKRISKAHSMTHHEEDSG